MSSVKIITTEDGSHSLYHQDLKETYHSFHGALQESRHVFIDKGLRYWRTKEGLPDFLKIFEVGLGTGLNALLAAQFAMDSGISIEYTGVEPFPLEEATIDQLNYVAQLESGAPGDDRLKNTFKRIHSVKWEEPVEIYPYFELTKHQIKLEDYNLNSSENFDIIFFDAFAPNKQAELWELSIIQKCYKLLKKGGVFVTYSAKGQLKRDLKSAGFEVETLPGPPGKKEMVRGVK
ncbi:tRNA (5-methylaminomethyl-2-thiouridine)(34)-methyltransferase MnmD [Marivirga sp. S37H4]|uniref:tRNA (5-methylaminomethyl-2-thiouridine)(34)-methyltransferase MnmD n=1 Tax=Marivirga aurantiaca TaxID=2802615 RepID=A0A935CD16_9BACT|nr:tRNA (5-methylaminomethyl-2-thiouridine)(34)-methyltransferase MnmD [Marivirga aurantiaca]MBK6266488.1 tRNA (5-methylaminomethyl-2-thiouridine)(34)-methyltransferase MnmD [Marivirga aurantiaca]